MNERIDKLKSYMIAKEREQAKKAEDPRLNQFNVLLNKHEEDIIVI